MKKYKCPKCGNVVEPDAGSAEVFCYNPDCGIMLDANRYVQEIEFANNKAVGKFTHIDKIWSKSHNPLAQVAELTCLL